ncbi:hypothetical protein GCM10011374_28790 [Kocuria dechangensis]|uniref:GH26 domain-containing protein n=1 Tax=Kocuria dechangensis TaxID=1176249 RepID=A0A917LWK7_9MICC|nr:glycosyl hydrolase [Kocuria dechangensis]GGG63589.1 hypothetical protein GCM10011374_28790 [Kocuria dechangensis]
MRELLPVALAATALLVVGGVGIAVDLAAQEAGEDGTAAAAECPAPARAELVPGSGALFGVNLDLRSRPLADYAEDLGRRPAVTVVFTEFPYDARKRADLQEAAEQVRADGHIMLLTLEPRRGLRSVTEGAAAALAEDLAGLNRNGVPVVVRFGHEMNGPWREWGQQPGAYVDGFRRVAAAVHAAAPGSAMMWAPNYGGGYPFEGSRDAAGAEARDRALLDTDGDGLLTAADDPYSPYWPGDDAVDWVGMSLYHWGSAHPWGENEVPEPGKFTDQLTGAYDGADGDQTAVPDFYAVYGEKHGKPVAIPETAAFWAPAAGGSGELAVKQAWWEQLFDPALAEEYPRLKMINWFEWDKLEPEVDAQVDWTATETPEVRDAFVEALPEWLHEAPEDDCG